MIENITNLSSETTVDRQAGELTTLIESLREAAQSHVSLSDFTEKTFSSLQGELQSAHENAATIRILDVLNHVNSEMAGAIEYEDRRPLLSMIAETVLILEGADVVTLYEVPETGERVKARPGTAGTLYYPDLMLDTVLPSNIIYSYLGSDQLTFIENVSSEAKLVAPQLSHTQSHIERFPIREKIESTIVVPLVFNQSPVGLMFINYRTAQKFDDTRKSRIQNNASHFALALHNMRSYRRSVEFTKQLENLFGVVDEINRHSSTPEQILDHTIEGMVKLIDAPRGAIVKWESDQTFGEVVAEYHGANVAATQKLPINRDSSLQRRVLRGEVCIIADVQNDADLGDRDREILLSAGIKSTLIVPILDDHQQVIASIGIDETRGMRRFLDKDVNLCKTLARQVATALRLAESTAQVRLQNRVQELQQQALALLLTESKDPDLAFEFIVIEGLKLIEATNGQLLRLSQDEQFLETHYSSNLLEIGLRYPVASSITGKAVSSREPQLIPNLDIDSAAKALYQGGYEQDMKSELAVPLIDNRNFEQKVIGVLNAESRQPYAFTSKHQRAWSLLSESIVKVIQITEIIAEKDALTSLNETQQRILQSSTSDTSHAAMDIVAKALEFADAVDDGIGQLLLLSEDRKELSIVASNFPGDMGRKVPVNKSISGIAIELNASVYVADIEQGEDPILGPYRDRYQWFANTKMLSELAVPLSFDHKAIGVINLEKPTTFAFTELHAKLVEALAYPATMIIQQSRLLQQEELLAERELQNRLEKQQNRDIANILHRLNNPLGAVRQFALFAEESLDKPIPNLDSVRSDLKKVRASVDKTAELVIELRSRLREVDARTMDMNQEVQQSVATWKQQRTQDELKRIDLSLKLLTGLPHARCGDKITYVILDILNNAFESVAPEQKCSITIETNARDSWVEVSITDNGNGISRHLWKFVFEESYYTKKPNRHDDSGGIGLWWDRRYVRGFGGDVIITRSEVNVGTTMTIRLPQYQAVN